MNIYDAIVIVVLSDSENEIIEAWQMLIDTGMAWKLQGWFGRTAKIFIKEGLCTAPSKEGV